jgi:hypothetical protein
MTKLREITAVLCGTLNLLNADHPPILSQLAMMMQGAFDSTGSREVGDEEAWVFPVGNGHSLFFDTSPFPLLLLVVFL